MAFSEVAQSAKSTAKNSTGVGLKLFPISGGSGFESRPHCK